MSLIDAVRARADVFLARFGFVARVQGGPVSVRSQSYRQQPLQNAQPKKRAIPLFGADPSGDFEDWASYRSFPSQGPASAPQALQSELRENDEDIDKEWSPNLDVPSLVSHGKKLDYSHAGDQRPTSIGHDIGPVDKKITLNGGFEPRGDFHAARGIAEPTIGDLHAIDLKKWDFDFST